MWFFRTAASRWLRLSGRRRRGVHCLADRKLSGQAGVCLTGLVGVSLLRPVCCADCNERVQGIRLAVGYPCLKLIKCVYRGITVYEGHHSG